MGTQRATLFLNPPVSFCENVLLDAHGQVDFWHVEATILADEARGALQVGVDGFVAPPRHAVAVLVEVAACRTNIHPSSHK